MGAKCLIFMKVVKLPTSRMRAVKDRIINVPMTDEDISRTVTSFPRTEEKAGVIAVKLKRMMGMKNCHAEEFINPEKPIKAVKKLKELGNPFYEGVDINENFLEKTTSKDDETEENITDAEPES